MSTNELIVSKEYGAGELSRESLAIRQTVFVSEQGVPLALEIDDLDDRTTHYVGFTASKAVTTARVLRILMFSGHYCDRCLRQR